ncbi:MAG: hypothetical protein L6R41_001726 [Letrouitia leprolyta]|nr:MAG: hypothetical protein L6R41_001726 [Letrouitia leprolyta]
MGKSKKSKLTKAVSASEISTPKSNPNPSGTARISPKNENDGHPAESEETDFDSYYLKQVTAEFADDLDNLRKASDFNEDFLPILIGALKGTAGVYSEEEKAKVMGGR